MADAGRAGFIVGNVKKGEKLGSQIKETKCVGLDENGRRIYIEMYER